MTATVEKAPFVPALDGDGADRAPGMGRLTWLEIRKLVDTRSGRWLGGITVTVSIAACVLMLLFGPEGELTAEVFFQITLLPVSLILPVLGIMSVTTEWTQRTALTTFTLVPQRWRIVLAKLLSGTAWALVTWAVCVAAALVCGWLAGTFDLGSGDLSLPAGLLAGGLLYQVLNVLMGVAFGMALLNTPLALVLFFVLPFAWTVVRELVPGIQDAAAWLDLMATTTPLTENAMTNADWQRLGTSVVLWVALPLVVGVYRVLNREVS